MKHKRYKMSSFYIKRKMHKIYCITFSKGTDDRENEYKLNQFGKLLNESPETIEIATARFVS